MSATISEEPIHTDHDLFRLWQQLMGEGGFGRRSLWLTFLEPDGCPAKLIVPIDDVPEWPDQEVVDRVVWMADQLCEREDLGSVPMCLSRPGSSRMTTADREWAKALRRAAGERHPWPVHLATEDHLQVFAPDDLV